MQYFSVSGLSEVERVCVCSDQVFECVCSTVRSGFVPSESGHVILRLSLKNKK